MLHRLVRRQSRGSATRERRWGARRLPTLERICRVGFAPSCKHVRNAACTSCAGPCATWLSTLLSRSLPAALLMLTLQPTGSLNLTSSSAGLAVGALPSSSTAASPYGPRIAVRPLRWHSALDMPMLLQLDPAGLPSGSAPLCVESVHRCANKADIGMREHKAALLYR